MEADKFNVKDSSLKNYRMELEQIKKARISSAQRQDRVAKQIEALSKSLLKYVHEK